MIGTISEEYKNLPNDIKVFDDFIPEPILYRLLDRMYTFDWPWFYLQETTYRLKYNDENKATWDEGFSTLLYVKAEADDDGNNTGNVYEYKSELYQFAEPIISHCSFALNLNNNLKRVKVNLNTSSINDDPFEPHLDIPKYNTWTGLLCLNDSDGPTYLYDTKCPDDIRDAKTALEWYRENKDNINILAKIKPKKNRFILFDGRYFHSGSRPVNFKSRYNLNINWVKD